jgi:hypothetical protein
MPEELKAKRMEIAHVLFMDIVGYSTRLTDEQQALVDELNQIVRSSDEFKKAAAAGRLMKIPTGDGMALIFYNSPEQPVECAVEISRVLRHHPGLPMPNAPPHRVPFQPCCPAQRPRCMPRDCTLVLEQRLCRRQHILPNS